MQTMVLLGAGASVKAGLPTANRLAGLVRNLICDPALLGKFMHSGAFYFHSKCVIPMIDHIYARLVELVGGANNLDVELFGAAVDDAAKMDMKQIAPMINEINPDLALWRKDGGKDAGRYVRDAVRQETWLSAEQAEITSYLKWIFEVVGSSYLPTIATLNYDNAVELCASLHGHSLAYGFDTGWRPNKSLEFPQSTTALLKLHGSSNWSLGGTLETDETVAGGFAPVSRHEVRVFDQSKMDKMTRERSIIHNSILFGRGIKIRYEGPYIALQECFRKRLDSHDAVVIVGYSFRDRHINDDLANWLEQGERRRVVVVAPDADASWRIEGGISEHADRVRTVSVPAEHENVLARVMTELN